MKIIIYNPKTKEFNDFIDSLHCVGIKRDKAVESYLIKTGKEISVKEFLNNKYNYTHWSSELRYKLIGEPCNPLEKIVKFIYGSSSYIHMKRSFPEDFVESRTDWNDMADYADEMASFIEELMDDLSKQE